MLSIFGLSLQGRTTLLMGPPGAGKTVFLKMLAGRFKPSADLRMSGSVKYNGCTSDEFVVERTVGLVDQYDSAPPDLPGQTASLWHPPSLSTSILSGHGWCGVSIPRSSGDRNTLDSRTDDRMLSLRHSTYR